jgi:multimeric flavodoxin WrbA
LRPESPPGASIVPNLLIVCHIPSDNTRELRDAVVAGARDPDAGDVEVRDLKPLDAGADDVLWCDGIIIGTTENFGYMAGLTKDFLERVYYPCLERKQGLPAAVYVRAGQDGRGTRDALDKILTGLRWRHVHEPLILRGDYAPGFPGRARELGLTMAAGLAAGIF